MRIYISADIEGVTGISSWGQAGSPSSSCYDWNFARRMYTQDVSAAVRGARQAGAKRVVVKDGHNYGNNLLVDELPDGTELISGYGAAQDGMMQGIDEGFDAALLIGYHSKAGTASGVLEHALAGGLHRFWVNDVEAGEILASAAVAGELGVPLVFVSSDHAGCEEAKGAIPGVLTYATKVGYGKFAGRMLHPSDTKTGIEQGVKHAVQRARSVQPLKIAGPVTLRAEFHTSEQVDFASKLEGVTRLDGYTIELTRETFRAAHTAIYNVFYLARLGRMSAD